MDSSINVTHLEETPAKEEYSGTAVSRSTSTGGNEDQNPTVPKFKASKSLILAFVSLCFLFLAANLDATSLSIALPTISSRLSGTAIEAFWAGTSFLVTSAVFQPVIGGLSHGFGRKQMVLLSCLFFAVGSLVAALANNFTTMLVGRAIQGTGGGGILALCDILVTDLFPLSVRGTWFGFLASVAAIGTVAGPLTGGGFAISSFSGWRWIFWINLPLIGIGFFTTILFLKIERLKEKVSSRFRKFDWFGSSLFVASAVSFLVPISWGGIMYTWNSWHTLVPLLLGLAGMFAFGYYEYLLTSKAFDEEGNLKPGNNIHPVVPSRIFSNWTLRLVYLHTLVHGIVLWSLLYFLPLYYEVVKGYTPIISGVAVLPETVLIAPTAIFVGIVSSKTGRYRWAIWLGWVLTTLGFGILYLLDTTTSVPAFIFLNVPVSLGTGMAFNSMSLAIQAAGRPQDAGYAVTFHSFSRVFGESLGVAIGGVVFQNQIRQRLSNDPALSPLAEEYSRDATALGSVLKAMQPGMEKTRIIQTYADSLKIIWVVMAALSGAMLLSSVFIKGYSLDQEHKTLQGFNGESIEKKGEDPKRS